MSSQKANEAARDLMKVAQESSKVFVDTAITTQQRNLAFAQSILENSIEVLKSHAESSRTLMQELVEQARKQQSGPEGVQAVVDSAVSAQERNAKLTQSVLENGVELLKSQVEVTHSLLQELRQQSQKQQEILQHLAQQSMDAYKDFLFAPLTFWQRAMDTAEAATVEGLKNFQQATQQGVDAMQKSARQAASVIERSVPRP